VDKENRKAINRVHGDKRSDADQPDYDDLLHPLTQTRAYSLRVALVGFLVIIAIVFAVVFLFLFVLFLVGLLSKEGDRRLPTGQECLSRRTVDAFCPFLIVRLAPLAKHRRSQSSGWTNRLSASGPREG
jgi:hypothetical protein